FRLVKAYEAYDKLFTFLNDKYPNKLAAWKTRHDNVKKEYQKVMDKLKVPQNAIADNEARSWAYPLDYYFKKEEDAYEALLVLTSINNNISMRELGTVPYKSVVLYDDDYDPSLLASFAENIRMFAEEHVEFNMLEACDMYWQYNYAVQYALTMPTTDVKTLTTTRLSVKDSDSPLKDYFEFSGRFAKTHVEGKLGSIPAGLRAINAASEKVASKKDLPFLMDYVAKNPAKAIEVLPKPKNDVITRAKVEEPKPVPAPEVKVEVKPVPEVKKEEVKVEVKPEVKVEAPKKEEVKPEVKPVPEVKVEPKKEEAKPVIKVEEPIIIDTSVPKHIINQPNVEELKPSVLDEYYREKYTLANSTIKYFKEWKAKIIAEITEERDSLSAAADNEHNDVKTYLGGYGALLTTLKATDRRLDTMAVALKEFYDKTAKCLKVKRRLISDEHLESAKKMNKRTHEFIMGLGTILSGFAASNLCDPEYGYTFAELTEVKIEECIENFRKEIGCEADVIDDNHVKTVATDIDKASAKQSLLIKEIEKKYSVKADLEAKTPDRWLKTKDKMSTEDYAKLVYFTDVIERIRDINVVRHSENFDEIKNEVLNKSVVKKKVAALTKNPVFKAVAKANPDEAYSAWKTVEEDARNMKDDFINALGDYRKPTLGDYIMYGECAEDVVKERDELLKSANLTPAQYKQEMKNILGKYDPISAQQMADDAAGYEAKYEAKCYHRLALITTMKLLSNDSNEVILQGVAAGQYEISSIVEKVQEHLESKKFISDNMMKFGITQMNLDLDGKKYYDDIMKSVVKQMKAENAAKIEVKPNMAGAKKNAPNAPSM
ncbi:MAG: hypothetical protein II699_07795, partial [Lachnospiraceae bacterium]|nr:hypothetical protein [Lachnospiraceae bacterium]